MRAFIIRPFGTKSDINFDEVQKQLIAPALASLDIQGSTTEPFLQSGNIRADMFQQILVADIVIAIYRFTTPTYFTNWESGTRSSPKGHSCFAPGPKRIRRSAVRRMKFRST